MAENVLFREFLEVIRDTSSILGALDEKVMNLGKTIEYNSTHGGLSEDAQKNFKQVLESLHEISHFLEQEKARSEARGELLRNLLPDVLFTKDSATRIEKKLDDLGNWTKVKLPIVTAIAGLIIWAISFTGSIIWLQERVSRSVEQGSIRPVLYELEEMRLKELKTLNGDKIDDQEIKDAAKKTVDESLDKSK
jgi:hypothetical protein